ncbi:MULTISPECIES: ATP-binding protein [Streptomyces]|uniref:Biotin transporter BioY n=2 Tax=Streptomyces TaxID=1883 RepID=A0A8H9HP49_9ACTN|nr:MULTISPECIES: ATP-binding protein [Streptomyces]MBL3803857.1 ATP-binding protein [Streptomyces sp. BRB081]WSU35168.1 ATP-binding protein [Streptomyces gougerotii]SUP59870.1 BldA-regulated nucleotide binding protein [Streptomyces griseus]GFH68270.1 biotin transporter BioY [Streptomyces rutgersensis]GFH78901.1 biotin transporter BioY [Streptomyces gougerotii]
MTVPPQLTPGSRGPRRPALPFRPTPVRPSGETVPGPRRSPSDPPPRPDADEQAPQAGPRPAVTELRLSAYAGLRRTRVPLGPLTLLAGPSGSGRSTVLGAYAALAALGSGTHLGKVFPDPAACVPENARPDAQRRRGFRIGCTVDGPVGPVRLDLAVQAEPALRVVGERLTWRGVTLLETALRDPGRRTVQAAWHTAGAAPVTRGPLPDDQLGTALLPLRVAGRTAGERQVLAAAEQVVVALRSVFACDPRPAAMRAPVPVAGGRLLPGCDNLADVLLRTRTECAIRHGLLVSAVREAALRPVHDVLAELRPGGAVEAVLDRGAGPRTPLARLGDGELRHLALALVLLTGPGVLEVDPAAEVPGAYQCLTVLADGLDRDLDARQLRGLVALAGRAVEHGHIRLIGAVRDAGEGAGADPAAVPGATVVDLTPDGAGNG